MSDELKIIANESGTFEEYDDTYDITIHCESETDQEQVLQILNGKNLMDDMQQSIRAELDDLKRYVGYLRDEFPEHMGRHLYDQAANLVKDTADDIDATVRNLQKILWEE